MRNNESKEPALRFDSYKFLFHRARLATFATQSARTGREQTQQPECPEGRLLDDLVGRDLQRQRHCEAQRLRGVKVDRQFELVQLLDRQIGRVFSLEDSTRINAALVKTLAYDCPVAHQATNLNELAPFIDRRYLVPRGKRNELLLPAGKEWIGAHEQRIGPLMSQRDENIFKLGVGRRVQHVEAKPERASSLLRIPHLRLGDWAFWVNKQPNQCSSGHHFAQ